MSVTTTLPSTSASADLLDLRPLYEAESVAMIGASERMNYSRKLVENLAQVGFDMERFHPVNPRYPELFGRASYPSVLDVPDSVDLALIVTGAQTVAPILRQCAEKRVQAALVLTDGFAESGADGRVLQDQIAAIAREGGIRLVGPNCFGFLSPAHGLGVWAGDLPTRLRDGNVAAVFQSSGMLNLFLTLAAERRVGFHLATSAGNQAVLSTGDYLWHAVGDPKVEAVVAVVESIVAPDRFVAALDRAAELAKPVVVLRVGRSERGRRNALAHTGNLAGSGAAWDALLRQKGAIVVEDIDELLEATVLFSAYRPSPRTGPEGLGLVTISGGDCSLLCDLAEREGVMLPDLTPETRATLVAELDKPTLLGNPFDVENLQRQDEDAFYRCLDAFLADTAFAFAGARLNLPTTVSPAMRKAYEYLASAAPAHGKRPVFFSRASETLADAWLDLFEELRVPLLKEYRKGLRTLRRFVDYERFLRRRAAATETLPPPLPPTELAALRAMVADAEGRVLGYVATERLLDAYGIRSAPARLVDCAADARTAAGELGWPVALKVASPDIPHKSDVGALALDLASDDDVASAFERVMENARRSVPGARIEGVVVQQMVGGVAETIVGLSIDPQLGPVLMFGLGGVFVEIMRDVAFRVGPLTPAEARDLVGEVRGAALLRGARGRPRADEEALVDTLVRVSRLGSDLRDVLAELDLNPIVVLPEGRGALVVDALAVRAEPESSEEPS